ncbi:hypothetical protein [Pilimelia terevasa]|nr:hypothetical protein [Pilimelia terevasa]
MDRRRVLRLGLAGVVVAGTAGLVGDRFLPDVATAARSAGSAGPPGLPAGLRLVSVRAPEEPGGLPQGGLKDRVLIETYEDRSGVRREYGLIYGVYLFMMNHSNGYRSTVAHYEPKPTVEAATTLAADRLREIGRQLLPDRYSDWSTYGQRHH